jgi:hypothetical protein
MKSTVILLLSVIMVYGLTGCLSQQITSSWVTEKEIPEDPYESICVIALIPDRVAKIAIEDETVALLKKRGYEAMRSMDLLVPRFSDEQVPPKGEMVEVMKKAGCDGVLTITELAVKSESRYVPGFEPAPLPPYHFRYYDSYYSYYSYRYRQIYEPGYIIKESTYFFETNFYDLETEELLWSIQTSAFEPTDAVSWFYEHSRLITKQLKKEGILDD